MTIVSQAIQARVAAKVQQCIDTAKSKYGYVIPLPQITYNVRGTCGGKADYAMWAVMFNPILLNENVEEYLEDVVPHECAHLITHIVYPKAHQRGCGSKRRPHGAEWQSVMRVLGADPTRCHKYDVKNARVKTKKRFEYQCSCCKKTIMVTKQKHEQIQMSPNGVWHQGCTRQPLIYKGVKPDLTTPVTTPRAPASPKAGTKLDQCLLIYQTSKMLGRDAMISEFMRNVGMSKPFATTYYYQCRKLDESGV